MDVNNKFKKSYITEGENGRVVWRTMYAVHDFDNGIVSFYYENGFCFMNIHTRTEDYSQGNGLIDAINSLYSPFIDTMKISPDIELMTDAEQRSIGVKDLIDK